MQMTEVSATMKMIKWARKQGACLIKVNGVELTFPLDVAIPQKRELRHVESTKVDDIKAEKALRQALSSDSLHQIEDQEQWFHNNRPPQI